MKNNFWNNLPRPFFVLAPMADVTDAAFRRLIAKYGKPDVMYTQFVSCDGLCSPGRDALLVDFWYGENERPIVAQIFGATPENFYKTAKLVAELGFDGVDINMGCPDKSVCKQGAGAALIKNPSLAKEIIQATKEGSGDLPVSVKTRLGDTKNIIDTWLPEILSTKPAAVIVHARTKKEMSKVPAHWDQVKHAVEIARGSGVPIVGNGDVVDLEDGRKKAEETGCDGIMIGRGIFGNPWCFNPEIKLADIDLATKLKTSIEHTRAFEEILGKHKNFVIMKKHFKAYASGFDGAKELRIKLMEAKDADEIEQIINEFLKKLV
jgi:nifR3 family TIM-barrel protein